MLGNGLGEEENIIQADKGEVSTLLPMAWSTAGAVVCIKGIPKYLKYLLSTPCGKRY